MRCQCPASWLRVPRLPTGRAECPVCGDAWHVLTADNRLRAHQAIGTLSEAHQRALELAFHHQMESPDFLWPGWPEMRRLVVERDAREQGKGLVAPPLEKIDPGAS
jgi:hypothetical protein